MCVSFALRCSDMWPENRYINVGSKKILHFQLDFSSRQTYSQHSNKIIFISFKMEADRQLQNSLAEILQLKNFVFKLYVRLQTSKQVYNNLRMRVSYNLLVKRLGLMVAEVAVEVAHQEAHRQHQEALRQQQEVQQQQQKGKRSADDMTE